MPTWPLGAERSGGGAGRGAIDGVVDLPEASRVSGRRAQTPDDDDVPMEIWERRASWPKPSARWPYEPPAPSDPGADPPAGSLVPSNPSPRNPGPAAAAAEPGPSPTSAESKELMAKLPLLEAPRGAALDDDESARLVAYGLTAWSDWWAGKALDWVDDGVWSDAVAEGLRSCARDRRYSQRTRHRAWAHIKPRGRPGPAPDPASDLPDCPPAGPS